MPDGLLQWYDPRRGEGRVVRGSRQYPVRAADIEAGARIPGARVHFDVRRDEGINLAVNVRLRPGTRVSRRQRRFGDMAGARAPDTRGPAPFAHPHPELGHRLASRPSSVAERWGALVAAGDIEGAMLLYAPDAVVHTGGGDLGGRRLHGWLSTSGLPGHIRSVRTAGAGDHIIVRWQGPGGRAAASWMRIEHSQIAEQWEAGRRPRARRAPSGPVRPDVTVVARDAQAEAARDYAEQKVRRVIEAIGEPVLHARVKLAMAPDPAVERPARAEAALDVNGDLVRAHVAAHTLHEAVDLLEPRLRAKAVHAQQRVRTLHVRPPEARSGEWRHGQAPTDRPTWYDRPAEEREVVRRKTFALDELTIDEAADDMAMLDFDFYLFSELATGVDAVLRRRPDGRLGLRRLHPVDLPPATEAEVVLEPDAAPDLAVEQAVEWLDVAGEPFVFFRNSDTGRAGILYRRYDGHYGLVVPADEPPPPAEPSTARRRLGDELARLEAVRAALVGEGLAEESEAGSVGETSTVDQHQADLATETFERERDQSLLEDIEQEIADVQRAFVRLDRGTYGRCEACGTQIPDDRLAAMPATRFCLEHQAAAEVITGVT